MQLTFGSRANTPVCPGKGENIYVNLRWFGGVGRCNNGGTNHKDRHLMRLVPGRVQQKRQGSFLNKETPTI